MIAMLISPGIIAFLLCRSFGKMILVAILVSVSSSYTGTVVSFHIDGATGACIVLVQALYFVLALIYNQLRLSALKRRRQVA